MIWVLLEEGGHGGHDEKHPDQEELERVRLLQGCARVHAPRAGGAGAS